MDEAAERAKALEQAAAAAAEDGSASPGCGDAPPTPTSVDADLAKRNQIYGMGLPRTGTHSLAEALKHLGCRGLNKCVLTRSVVKHVPKSKKVTGYFDVDNSRFTGYFD